MCFGARLVAYGKYSLFYYPNPELIPMVSGRALHEKPMLFFFFFFFLREREKDILQKISFNLGVYYRRATMRCCALLPFPRALTSCRIKGSNQHAENVAEVNAVMFTVESHFGSGTAAAGSKERKERKRGKEKKKRGTSLAPSKKAPSCKSRYPFEGLF